jgi:hypothetical protein
MREQRTFPRLDRDWEIEYQELKLESSHPILIKSEISDFGAGGFSFRSGSAFPSKGLFQFAIKPTDDFKPMVGVARIAWTRGQEGFYESGAQFVWVNWKGMDVQTAIANYVLDNISQKSS